MTTKSVDIIEAKPSNLRQKMALVVDMIDGIEKKGRNEAQSYDFIRAIDVARTVRQALVEVGIYAGTSVFEQVTTVIPREGKPPLILSDVLGRVTFYDTESDDIIVLQAAGQGADYGGDKATPKAITSMIKYALRSAFLIPDEKADPEIATVEAPIPTVAAPLQTPPTLSHPVASDTSKAALRAKARAKGLDGDTFKAYVKGVTGKESSKDLTIADVDKAIAWLEDADFVATILAAVE